MANNAHPFVVGEQYRTEIGVCTVQQIEDPDIVIQYEDGHTQRLAIELLARIWERIQLEDEMADAAAVSKRASRRHGGSRGRGGWGRDFEGLAERDFARELAGTSWRRREELGGLLADRLSGITGESFESHAVPRRPQVHIVYPHHYKQKLRVAKFLFDLSEREAFYAFYVEKSDKPMDETWDWLRFTAALADDRGLQARTLVAMESCHLRWTVNLEALEDRHVVAKEESLWLQGQDGSDLTPLDWDGFVELLAAIPANTWCNLYLGTQMDRERAIGLGAGLATEVANVYSALLPLYQASVRKQ